MNVDQFFNIKKKLERSWESVKGLTDANARILIREANLKLYVSPKHYIKNISSFNMSPSDKQPLNPDPGEDRTITSKPNKFEITFPGMPETLIPFAKVVAVLRSDNAQNAGDIYIDNNIEIWEKLGSGYKLTVYVNPEYPSDMQAYIDLKLYFYNEKEYNGF